MRVFSELLMGSCKTILRFLVMLVGGLQVDSGTEHTKRHRKSRYLELEIFIIYFNFFHVRLFFEIEVSENPKNLQIPRFPLKFLAKFQGKPTKIVEKSWKLGYFSSYWAYSNRSTGLRMGFSCGLAPCSFGLRILSLAAIFCPVRSRKQSRIRGIPFSRTSVTFWAFWRV